MSLKLTSLKIHNVSISFIKEIKALGFKDISLSKLTSLKIHDLDADYIKEAMDYLKKRGKEVTLERIIRMKIHDL